jgi:CHAT domain-containing protein/tetratricopeptide (TPR) repeat protein
MSVRDRVAKYLEKLSRPRAVLGLSFVALVCVGSCTDGARSQPSIEFSSSLQVSDAGRASVVRSLLPGTYVIEIREQGIDLSVDVEAAAHHVELTDAQLRHGLQFAVVRLEQPGDLRIALRNADQRDRHGAGELRILRWPDTAGDVAAGARLRGYTAFARAGNLLAQNSEQGWRGAAEALREASEHFTAAADDRLVAEVEYARGWIEYSFLLQWQTSARSAETAQSHFRHVDDDLGAMRSALLRALAELEIGAGMKADTQRAEQRALFVAADRMAQAAQKYFHDHGQRSDEMYATTARGVRHMYAGEYDEAGKYFTSALTLSRAGHDKLGETASLNNLGWMHDRRGEMASAAEIYERLLPLVDREGQPDVYATVLGNFGNALIALGDFDRALALHTEALAVFSARGDTGQRAREFAALGSLYFRAGNVERALATVRSALPLYEQAGDNIGLVGALRLAGNAAAELDQHETAVAYLRKAESVDPNLRSVDRTRVLIAGELRALGDGRAAEQMLAAILTTKDERTRADAFAERARLRRQQHRAAEALEDFRLADAIYQRLNLDFDRIDTSAALAQSLLENGELPAAAAAADAAIGIENRIRVNSGNPELRARFLSASYAPYEARIAIDLAEAAGGNSQERAWKGFHTAEAVRGRSLADQLAVRARTATAGARDLALDRLRERLTALQLRLEDQAHRQDPGGSDALELQRSIGEARARLEAHMLVQQRGQRSGTPSIPNSLRAAQVALPADTAVLAYFVGDATSHGWLLTRNELRHITFGGRRAMQALINEFVAQQRETPRAASPAGLTVLLGDLLRGVRARRLLVLPDGPLNGLPFAALPNPDGARGAQLIDRFVISAAPSLALALRNPTRQSTPNTRVAVISDPVYAADDGRLSLAASTAAANYRGKEAPRPDSLTRLPFSALEARAVVRAFKGVDTTELAGFDATVSGVLNLATADLGVLHFATHAVARRDAPEQSALFLSEYAVNGAPVRVNRLTAEDIARSGLRADVVVLSGCATGDGGELRGEGVLGLTYGFLANGSRTVIASLWPIQDASTARFMDEFYRAYRVSGRAAEALRDAQLRTRATGAAAWSSFVVRANEFP